MYKEGDVVWVRSRFIEGVPLIRVKLLKKEIYKGGRGKYITFPPYVGWEGVLISKEDCDMLRKDWCIPFKFPDDVETFVFEEEIVRRVNKKK